jgi:1-acyl-sn-glycerol-3-phosphate acyltransferase
MKQYYSSTKEYYKVKRHWPFFRLLSKIIGKSYKGKIEVRYAEPLPQDESIAIAPNHAREFGPMAVYFCYPRGNRMWLNSNLIIVKDMPNHLMKDFFINEKGIKKALLKLLCYIISPILSAAMKSIEVIPVYRDMRIRVTLKKTSETLSEGKDVVIFPESNVSDELYKYTNVLQEGFVFSAKNYYNHTGKKLKYYPAYACKDLNILSFGHPVEYDPAKSLKEETVRISKHIRDEIERLGNELPPHKIVPYGEVPESSEAMDEYNARDSKYTH